MQDFREIRRPLIALPLALLIVLLLAMTFMLMRDIRRAAIDAEIVRAKDAFVARTGNTPVSLATSSFLGRCMRDRMVARTNIKHLFSPRVFARTFAAGAADHCRREILASGATGEGLAETSTIAATRMRTPFAGVTSATPMDQSSRMFVADTAR